jgi:hypothetical protein
VNGLAEFDVHARHRPRHAEVDAIAVELVQVAPELLPVHARAPSLLEALEGAAAPTVATRDRVEPNAYRLFLIDGLTDH